MKQPAEHRSDGPGGRGGRVGVFDLAENLRLANDQRVEAGGDAKQVLRRLEVRKVVDVFRESGSIDAVKVAEEGRQVGARGVGVLAGDVQLGPVAGGDHRYFAGRTAGRERPQRAFEAARLEVELLAQLHGRGAVTDADYEELHGHKESGDLVI